MRTLLTYITALAATVPLIVAAVYYAGDYRGRYFGEPLSTLTPADLETYEEGFQIFIKVWKPEEGLGPELNARSCATCHHIPVVGGTEVAMDKFVVHTGSQTLPGSDNTFARFELTAAGTLRQRTLPEEFTVRKTQPLYGIGLLESIPVSDILLLADSSDSNADGISGRLPVTRTGYGMFGWKSQFASVKEFTAFALAAELGLANEYYNDSETSEVDSLQLQKMTYFITHLAAPPMAQAEIKPGRAVFEEIGCTDCHTQRFRTVNKADPALDNFTIEPFSDMLLHNITESGEEFRTPPLWGLNSNGPPYFHDGSASSVRQAILKHQSEATRSRVIFEALDAERQEQVLEFLRSL